MTNSSLSSRAARGWTDERRARHAAAIRRWAPWKSSTGPRTAQGKYISSLNALKHGCYSRPAMAFHRQLSAFIRAQRALRENYDQFQRNELLKHQRLNGLRGHLKSLFKRKSGLLWSCWQEQVSICDPNPSMPIYDRHCP